MTVSVASTLLMVCWDEGPPGHVTPGSTLIGSSVAVAFAGRSHAQLPQYTVCVFVMLKE